AAGCAAFGLLHLLPASFGPVMAGLLFIVPLLLGLLMTVILVGLAAGWPLMHAAVAAGGPGGVDALRRAYAYVYQKPGRYAAYLGLAWVIGLAGLVVVVVFFRLAVSLAEWGMSWTMPPAQVDLLFRSGTPGPLDSSAATLYAFWLGVFDVL